MTEKVREETSPLREVDCVIRTKTESEKFWFWNFLTPLKQCAKVSNHAKFQSIGTINGWDMGTVIFELFNGEEFEKNKKLLLKLKKWFDFDENQ